MVGARRRNHEGHVRLRADGRYEAMYAIEGVRKSVYGKTEDEVLAKVRRAVTANEQGVRQVVASKVTVSDWLNEWLELYVAPVKAVRTTESYRDITDRYLIPYLGHHRLARLSSESYRIDRMLADLARQTKKVKRVDPATKKATEVAVPKFSPTTIRYVFVVFRIAMRRAVKAGRLQLDPTSFVDAPPPGRFEVEPMSSQEAAALMEALREGNHRYEALIRTLLSAGLRRGELLGLTWPAVDLKAGRIHVQYQLLRGDLVPPKRSSIRSVDIPPETVAALERHKASQVRPLPVAVARAGGDDSWDERDFVFAGEHGHPLNPRGVARAFDTVLRKAGLPHQRLHDLRHAFATILLESGEDLVIVSKLLGHKSLGTTADVYSHLTPDMRAGAASRMGAALRRKAK